jgi:hypothetical protein
MKNGAILAIYILSDVWLNIRTLFYLTTINCPFPLRLHCTCGRWSVSTIQDGQYTNNEHSTEERSRNHPYHGKAVLHILSVCTEWGSYSTQNVSFDFLDNFCRKYFSFSEEMSELLSQTSYYYSYKVV